MRIDFFYYICKIFEKKQEMNDKKQRIEWIDMAKGYGIILVLVGHVDMPYITKYIYAFHIPLFFFLSGCVYNTTIEFNAFFIKKIKKLVIPYFCLCLPMIFSELYFGDSCNINIDGIINEMIGFLEQKRHTTLWFLSTLILLNFITYPFIRYNIKHTTIIVVGVSLFGLLLWHMGLNSLIWNIDAALVVIPFFYAGFKSKSIFNQILNIPTKYILFSFILLSIITFAITRFNYSLSGTKLDIYDSTLGNIWLGYLSAFSGIVACIVFSMLFSNKAIKYLGKNSLLFFAWHQSIVFPALSYLYWRIGLSECYIYKNTYIFKWITVIFTFFIITLLNELISHTRLRFVIGKQK